MTQYSAISLFSGMGGDTLGMKNAGINVIAYSEFKESIRKTHDLNFPNCELLGKDVKSNIQHIPDKEFTKYHNKIHFLFAGFPCQSFSSAGKRKVNDPRNTLFKEFVRAAQLTNAEVIIGENVKGLLTKKAENGKLYIDIIVKEFENLGYNVIYQVCKCNKYSIPQKRERLIIIGIKDEYVKNGKYKLQFPEYDTTKDNGLENIIQFSMKNSMKMDTSDFDFSTIPDECIMKDMDNEEEEQDPHPYMLLKKNMENKSYKGKDYTTLFSFSKRDSPIHCEIIDIRKPSKTIICSFDHQPRLFVPIKNKNGNYLRMILPDELKQIQSFPADYKLNGHMKDQIIQIGNAVPPLVIEKIIKTIIQK